jgi:hypothetical protein
MESTALARQKSDVVSIPGLVADSKTAANLPKKSRLPQIRTAVTKKRADQFRRQS